LDIQRKMERLGKTLEAVRLQRNLTRQQVCAEAGLGIGALTRLEHGEGSTVESLLRIMTVLGLESRMEALLAPPPPSPLERVMTKVLRRRRARPPKVKPQPGGWTWGDDGDVQ
jgi:transcriptional regulator with XRE-family HTH domain